MLPTGATPDPGFPHAIWRMTVPEATDTTTTDTAADAPTVEPAGQQDEQLGEGGKEALIAEREARKAAEEALAEFSGMSKGEIRRFIHEAQKNKTRLEELEAASLSDVERAQRDAATAREEAAKATREALRYRFAAKHGISDEDAELFLTGETEEQVEAQAKRLAARAGASTQAVAPRPDLTQGGSGRPAATSKGEQFAQLIESKLT